MLSRRRFLAGAGSLAASVAVARPPALAGAADDATVVIRASVGPDDAWLLAHGIRGMGRGFVLKNGRRAVDHLLETHLEARPLDGKLILWFPPAAEVHSNSFLKTLLEAGLPLDYAFSAGGARYRLQDVLDSARLLFSPAAVAREPDAASWSLIAFARTTPPGEPRWRNLRGEVVDLDLVTDSLLTALETASAPIAEAMRARRPLTTQAPVHAFTCGGTHMIYSVLTAAQYGLGRPGTAARVRAQADLLVWRLKADVGLVDRFYGGRARTSEAEWYKLSAKLKLLGHAEECLALAATRRIVALTPAQQAARREAEVQLRTLLADLRKRDLAEARAIRPELLRTLIADACHARHGLTFA